MNKIFFALSFLASFLLSSEVVWDEKAKMLSEQDVQKALEIYTQKTYPQKWKEWANRFVFLDTQTNLMWQDDKSAATVTKNWQEAIDYCKNLSFLNYSDWRLPTKDELEDLFSKKEKLKDVNSFFYWGSTADASYSGNAWIVDFDDGYTNVGIKSSGGYVRCVRAGQ